MGHSKNIVPPITHRYIGLKSKWSSKGQKVLILSFHHKILLGNVNATLLMYYTMSRIEINQREFLFIVRYNRLNIDLNLGLNHFVKNREEDICERPRFWGCSQTSVLGTSLGLWLMWSCHLFSITEKKKKITQ